MRLLLLLLTTCMFACCGPSAEEKAAEERARLQQTETEALHDPGSPNTIKSCLVKIIFKSGAKDTVRVSYFGYLELRSDNIVDVRPSGMSDKTLANDVSAFSVIEEK